MHIKLLLIAIVSLVPLNAFAITAQVEGGTTSVLFGNGALGAIGLELYSVTPNVQGDLGPNSVAFGINPRNAIAPSLSTSLTYDSVTFAPFDGAINHTGRVSFNGGSVTVGDFTIKAESNRPTGASGFVVESTFGLAGILFDIANPIIEPFENALTIAGDIWVSPELADILGNSDFAGVDAGMALVVANSMAVPIPAAGWLFLGGACAFLPKLRRRISLS